MSKPWNFVRQLSGVALGSWGVFVVVSLYGDWRAGHAPSPGELMFVVALFAFAGWVGKVNPS
jgi:hypothetical protein